MVAPSLVIESVRVRSTYCRPSRSEPTTSIGTSTAAGFARNCLAMDVSPFLARCGVWTRHDCRHSEGTTWTWLNCTCYPGDAPDGAILRCLKDHFSPWRVEDRAA